MFYHEFQAAHFQVVLLPLNLNPNAVAAKRAFDDRKRLNPEQGTSESPLKKKKRGDLWVAEKLPAVQEGRCADVTERLAGHYATKNFPTPCHLAGGKERRVSRGGP